MEKQRRRGIFSIIGCVLFLFYFALLIYFALVSENLGRTVTRTEYRYNLELFAEIRRFYVYREVVGSGWAFLNILGNVICFMPFGFLVPMAKKKQASLWEIGGYAFLTSLVIELSQLVLKIGVFDVDDLLLNTLGGVLGYCLYRICRALYISWRRGRRPGGGREESH